LVQISDTALSLCEEIAININYFQQNQAERLVAAGRMLLIVFTLFAIRLYPPKAGNHIELVYYLLAGYLCYSVFLVLMAWRTHPAAFQYATAASIIDLLFFAVVMVLTRAPAIPFSAFIVFCLASASLSRLQRHGIVLTVAVALCIEITLFFFPGDLSAAMAPQINHAIYRTGYLTIVAAFFWYLGAYELRQRVKMAGLARWPRIGTEEVASEVSNILQHTASLLPAPRILLLWQEEEESFLHVACWSSGQFRHSLEPPESFGSLVAESLEGADFLCRNADAEKSTVLFRLPTGFEQRQGVPPLHPELQAQFSIKSVLSFGIRSERMAGRLLMLDKGKMDTDDLLLGKIIAREVACSLEQLYQHKRCKQAAAMEERVRLARDLHDGVLQSLAAAVLQLDSLHRLMAKDPEDARRRLNNIQKLLLTEQQDLCSHIRQLKPPYPNLPEWDGDLPRRLRELGERIENQWGLQTSVDVNLNQTRLPWTMAQGIYFIIHEAMINAARHAEASSILAEICAANHRMRIVVTDNGHGFPFAGRHEHAALTEANIGPVILRERVASLGGRLAIESGKTGARLEITLPIQETMG
jgi:signal transduction histidine kinase